VVLDATWAQARRMIQRIPALRSLPRISLPPRAPRAVDPIRQPTVAGGLCTLEAMAGVLHLLGETEAGLALDELHAAALDRSWRLRRGGVTAKTA
jgi:DTW domain-containing protein YfiP